MEGLQSAFRSAISQAQDSSLSSTIASSFEKAKASINSSGLSSLSSSALSNPSPTEPPSLLLTRAPRNTVTLWTCSKLCGLFFVAGVVVGYTLKRRVRRWASKLLGRLKDD